MKKFIILICTFLLLFISLFVIAGNSIEYGQASWYGEKFHGRLTASGEKFNMYDMTCAHRTHKFGTLLRVTNLENNKSVIVRVNDRGPFVRGRIVDLSKSAGQKINLIKSGVANVKVEVMKNEIIKSKKNSEQETSKKQNREEVRDALYYRIQFGAFKSGNSAIIMRNEIRKIGVMAIIKRVDSIYKVCTPRIKGEILAKDVLEKLHQIGLNGIIISTY